MPASKILPNESHKLLATIPHYGARTWAISLGKSESEISRSSNMS